MMTARTGIASRLSGRLSRRSLFGVGATASAAGVLVACSSSNNNKKSAATSAPAGAPSSAPSSAGTSAPRSAGTSAPTIAASSAAPSAARPTGGSPTAAVIPPPPAYSKAAAQKLLSDYHWSKIGPETQVLGTPAKGGVFAVATASFGLQSLSPTEEVVGQWPFSFTHNNLAGMDFRYTNNPDLLPATAQYGLASSWEQPDAQTLIFKLKPNITWQNIAPANGEPLTVKDIEATYEIFKADKFHGLNFKDIDRVEDAGGGTVRFISSQPAAQLLGQLRNPSFAVLNAKHIEEGSDALKNKAIGTGPFFVAKFQPNTVRSYKRNTGYWEKDTLGNQLPYLDGGVQTVITDKTAELAAFRSGQLDYYRPTSAEEFDRVHKELDTWASVTVGCGCTSPVIAPSARDPMFKDVRVRQALSLAVNRQNIIDNIFGGAAASRAWIPWYYRGRYWEETWDEMGPWYKYDPQQAKQLLQAAGIQPGVKIDISFAGQVSPGTNAAVGDAYVESVRQDLKAVGIELNLKPLDQLGLTRTFYGQQWNGLFSTSIAGIGLDGDLWVQALVTGSGLNGMGVSDPKVDELFKKERATTDTKAREQVFQDLEQYVNRDQLLRGIQMPSVFGFSLWRKYLHNALDTTSWWLNGGAGQQMAGFWLDDKAAKRNIDSY